MADLKTRSRGDTASLVAIAAAIVLAHLFTNGRYGFHRDELQFLSDALHLDWGFVAYPPLTPFIEWISLHLFGLSLVGLRLFSVLAQAAVIVVAGFMARDLGGTRLAQVAAALAVALSPLPLFEGTEFQYTTFGLLCWVLAAWFVIRLLKTENPRWCLAIGAAVGVGLMAKYTICFLVAGILAGFLLTPARRFLFTKWFAAGIALAALIFLPNFLWQVRHHFISLHWLQHIHARDVGEGRANHFFRDQVLVCANLVATPVWLAGLAGYLFNRRYRLLAWMYLVPLALFVIGKGRGYYLGGAYPALLAMGAVVGERWIHSLRRPWRLAVECVYFVGVVLLSLYACALIFPIASSGPLRQFALRNNTDLREEIGWRQLVQSVAAIRDSLPPGEQAHLGILVGNYGEAGAIEILGRAAHLPPPTSMTNSAWLRGYPQPPPATLIVLGFTRPEADRAFTACRLAGHNGNREGIVNEESQYHPDIFVCGPPRLGWPEFWKEYQSFG